MIRVSRSCQASTRMPKQQMEQFCADLQLNFRPASPPPCWVTRFTVAWEKRSLSVARGYEESGSASALERSIRRLQGAQLGAGLLAALLRPCTSCPGCAGGALGKACSKMNVRRGRILSCFLLWICTEKERVAGSMLPGSIQEKYTAAFSDSIRASLI